MIGERQTATESTWPFSAGQHTAQQHDGIVDCLGSNLVLNHAAYHGVNVCSNVRDEGRVYVPLPTSASTVVSRRCASVLRSNLPSHYRPGPLRPLWLDDVAALADVALLIEHGRLYN